VSQYNFEQMPIYEIFWLFGVHSVFVRESEKSAIRKPGCGLGTAWADAAGAKMIDGVPNWERESEAHLPKMSTSGCARTS
jgi:hypothetical protein